MQCLITFRLTRTILLLTAALLLCGAGSLLAADPPVETSPTDASPIPADTDLSTQILLLRSDDHAMREAASRALLEAGGPAVQPLSEAAMGTDPEVTVRAITVLEEMYTTKPDDVSEAAEVALQQLAIAEKPQVAARATSVLVRHRDLRRIRALAEFQALGGKIKFEDELRGQQHVRGFLVPQQNLPRRAPDEGGEFEPRTIHSLRIDEQWTGGEKGLRHIRALEHSFGTNPRIYYIRGANVPIEKVREVATKILRLEVEERGQATLGVMGGPGAPCHIKVMVGGAAAKAGLESDDVIVALDGEEITRFEDLVKTLKTRNAGERVPVKVERGIRTMEFSVTLGGWDEVEPAK